MKKALRLTLIWTLLWCRRANLSFNDGRTLTIRRDTNNRNLFFCTYKNCRHEQHAMHTEKKGELIRWIIDNLAKEDEDA